MSQVEQNAKTNDLDRRLRLMASVNVIFIALIFLAWNPTVRLVGEMMQWATLEHVSPRAGILDYPLTLMWGLPVVGTCLAWIFRQSGSYSLALWAAGFPLLYLGALVAGFYIVPLMMR